MILPAPLTRWTPLLHRFLDENGDLVAKGVTKAGLPLNTDLYAKLLQRKWQAFKEQYQKFKRDCKVSLLRKTLSSWCMQYMRVAHGLDVVVTMVMASVLLCMSCLARIVYMS
jgi:hypothetical protein